MAAKPSIRIGISVGDTAGIGMEVILKGLSDTEVYADCSPIIYGSESFFREVASGLDGVEVPYVLLDNSVTPEAGQVYLSPVWAEMEDHTPGRPTSASGLRSFQSLEAVSAALLSGDLEAMVTAPIDKKNIQQKGFEFPGHTEYLAAKDGSDQVLMLLVSQGLRVGVVTGHIPLRQVSDALRAELILDKIRMIYESLRMDFGIDEPRIAVLGLNPHAGDGGLLGSEEEEVISPAIRAAHALDIQAMGPFPADGFFGSTMRQQYDGVLAMYHDQGLAPFKALSFGGGVNFTAGLSIIRTSPDHGTAFDIAGKDKANGSSFRQAFRMAVEIHRNRLGKP